MAACFNVRRLTRRFTCLPRKQFALVFVLSIVIFGQVIFVSRNVLFVDTAVHSRTGSTIDAIKSTNASESATVNMTGIYNFSTLLRDYSRVRNRTIAKAIQARTRLHKGKHVVSDTANIINVHGNRFTETPSKAKPVESTLDYRILHEYWPPVKFRLVTPTITPKLNEKFFLLVMIHSGVHSRVHIDRRNAIRRTWANNRTLLGNDTQSKPAVHSFRVVFLLGRTYNQTVDEDIAREAERHNDMVIGDFPDNYTNIIIKVYMGFKWVHEHVNCKFVLKGDDDFYIYLPRLMGLLQSAPSRFFGGYVWRGAYVARDIKSKHAISKLYFQEDHYPPYCAGIYALTKNLLPELINLTSKFRPFHVEDAYLGILLRHMRVQPSGVYEIIISDWMPWHVSTMKRCELATAIAVGHNFNASHIEDVHSKILAVDPEKLSQSDWMACQRRRIDRNQGNVLAAVFGIFICLILVFVFIMVAYIPDQFELDHDDIGFIQRRRNYYPYVHRVAR